MQAAKRPTSERQGAQPLSFFQKDEGMEGGGGTLNSIAHKVHQL